MGLRPEIPFSPGFLQLYLGSSTARSYDKGYVEQFKMPEADEEYFQDRSSLAGLAHALCMAGGHRDLANADV